VTAVQNRRNYISSKGKNFQQRSQNFLHFEAIATCTQPGQINGIPKTNQDSYCSFSIDFNSQTKELNSEDADQGADIASFVAVFDGHGTDGHFVSRYLAKEIYGKVFFEKFSLTSF
jgi:serine/threonine protein phosphatase PrpC